jgi:hypothetical protein
MDLTEINEIGNKTKGYTLYVNNQDWNEKNLEYLEFYAAFANPDLIGKTQIKKSLFGLFKKEEKVDPTEGRWKKIKDIPKKYGIHANSSGIEAMSIFIPGSTREDANKRLEEMFGEIKEVCGPEYPLKCEIHDISISIIPLKYQNA